MQLRSVRVLAVAIVALLAGLSPALAQITTGTVTGTVRDAQGGVIPGATVVLTSESRGTKLAAVVTNEAGVFVVPNVTADTYTLDVTMDSFKTVRRTGIAVSGGDRVGVPAVTLEPGAIAETVNVTAEAAVVQSQSGERSFAITTEQIENLPIGHGNFTNLTAFTPGVVSGGASAGGTRLGGVSQNNIMMDGVSAMDTGNNGQMLNMNIESIGEVKILTQGYQAEYGRSSGLQITAVTKSGTNRFRGSAYDLMTDSDWNENSWVREKNGDPKLKESTKTLGYTIGGPIGKPGGTNKLFFFYAHEYRPTTSAINGGNPIRLRVPTALERQGNFSESLDNNGALIPNVLDPQTRQAYANRIIPQDKLYPLGVRLLNRYPMPTLTQAAGTNYNYEVQAPTVDNLIQQPAIRIDYQLSSKLRVTGKYSGQRERRLTRPGLIAGFTDVYTPYPYITNYAATVNYTINPTTFLEGTYGFIRNELVGGNENGILVNDSANRLNGLADFPLLYPNAGAVDNRYYAYEVMKDVNPVFWDGANLNLPPVFGWGSRIGAAPPNQRYPGWLNINRTQDWAASLTKVMGRHTLKAGVYNNHSFKAQNTGAGGLANLSFQGYVNFGNDTNNVIDSGFGYANAALGVFTQYLQAEKFIEGQMIYNNTEFYVQDNWKVNTRMTVDYGLRFTRQQPQYDKYLQMSNFFPEKYVLGQAPILYAAGCVGNPCVRNAMDPRTGQILTVPGLANTSAAIGTPIPGTGNLLNGIVRAGDGIAKTGYTWPTIVAGPRFGMAYDLSGSQSLILRAGGGLFFDRPDGNTVFSIPGNPPIATAQDLRSGQLQNVGTGVGLTTIGVPGLVTFQYDAKVPAQWQWNVGIQKSMAWSTSFDVSYVGNHGYNRLGGLQGGTTVNLNSVDIGAAFLPQNQDPTQTSTVPGQNTIDNALRPYKGLGNINQNTTEFWDTYHSIQTSLNRRFRDGFSFGVNYTYGISFKGNTGLQKRLVHNADGSITVRADQAEYEKLNETLDRRPHIIKANAVWDLPKVPASFGAIGAAILNDWQISGVLSAGSAPAYDLSYTYQNNGANKNITGSPDFGGRVVFLGDPGSGCDGDQYAQFDRASVTGATYGSVGLESGRNILRGCYDKTIDLSLVRSFPMGGGRELQFRLDAFNAFNTVVINGRQTQVQFNSPTDLTVRNPQFVANAGDTTLAPNATGSVLNSSRLLPKDAGFGAATGAQNMRNLAMAIRFRF
jgi:Carboxypeptidase regulatory-like domain/TonB-dependent Receptor Plug Domain